MIGSLLTDSAASRSSRINIDSSLGEEEQEIGIDGTAQHPRLRVPIDLSQLAGFLSKAQ